MRDTYLDLTTPDGNPGERRFALHMTETDLGLIADLLNSVNDLRAVPLRRALESTIRANDMFNLEMARNIETCLECEGTGSIKTHDEFAQTVKKVTCSKCNGQGQRVCINTFRYEPLSPAWRDRLAPTF